MNQSGGPPVDSGVSASILGEAARQEGEYDWLGAAESYVKALKILNEHDVLSRGAIYEQRSYALYRAAMQADSLDESKDRIRQALSDCEKGRENYESAGPGEDARTLRASATTSFLKIFLITDAAESKKLADEARGSLGEALGLFEKRGDGLEYGRTFNRLFQALVLALFFEDSIEIFTKAMQNGEQAIRFLATTTDSHELARAYVTTAFLIGGYASYLSLEEGQKYFKKAQIYWQKGKGCSEEIALSETSLWQEGLFLLGKEQEDQALLKKILEQAEKTRDRVRIRNGMYLLSNRIFTTAQATEDPDQRSELARNALRYREQTEERLSSIPFWNEIPPVELWAFHYWMAQWETNIEEKRTLLRRMKSIAEEGTKKWDNLGAPPVTRYASDVFSRILTSLARIETSHDTKKALLERALEQRRKSLASYDKFWKFNYFARGRGRVFLADILAELADLADNLEERKGLLHDAVTTMDTGCKLFSERVPYEGFHSDNIHLGGWTIELGDLLVGLYALDNRTDNVKKAIEAFAKAAEIFDKLAQPSRVAECHWRAASAFDALEDHKQAAESFLSASDNYNLAIATIPRLKEFYREQVLYMEAWSHIEKARHYHSRQEYDRSREEYQKAGELHKSSKNWNYLSPNYSSWAQVEKAEDLSRSAQCEEAMKAFREAGRLFQEGRQSIETQLKTMENSDEKQMATKLVKVADLRQEYCDARITLEEARILDKKGDHYSSSEKYGQAAGTFEKITRSVELDQTRQEFKLLTILSKAWQTMTRAEATDTPELYLEASRLFDEAKQLGPTEAAIMLASGHSRYSKALEAGTRFADTRESSLRIAAVRDLESAANYYLKAGFQNASEYAKATKFLFDGYMYMDEASTEKDGEKKTRFYDLAEKVLQASAESFGKAEYPGKKTQVLGLLEKVRGERELAVSLTDVFHAPSFVSTTATFPTPRPALEKAVGLDRFENADIQASVITRQKHVKVNEDLDLEIELVNAGKGPAQLIKLEEIIPSGFELTRRPEPYRLEDSSLMLKGKRLDPLKTEEIKLVIRAKTKGQFTLRPRILYLDESGRYKTHEPEPVEVTVKELGLSGWVKGR